MQHDGGSRARRVRTCRVVLSPSLLSHPADCLRTQQWARLHRTIRRSHRSLARPSSHALCSPGCRAFAAARPRRRSSRYRPTSSIIWTRTASSSRTAARPRPSRVRSASSRTRMTMRRGRTGPAWAMRRRSRFRRSTRGSERSSSATAGLSSRSSAGRGADGLAARV